MTQEEIQQVETYIAQIRARHAYEMSEEARYRKIAQTEMLNMGKAITHIMNLCKDTTTVLPSQLVEYVPKIVNHYCPDYDIPF